MTVAELWADLRYRLRALFRRTEVEGELDEELRYHLEREAAKYEALGLSPTEAARRARIAFGGVDGAKEASRDARGTILLETVAQDIRYAWRGLRAKPAFTVGVVLTLGLGIGANAAMFGVLDRLLFRPPEYLRDPAHVARAYVSWLSGKQRRTERELQFPRYQDFVRWTHGFTAIAAFHTWRVAVGDGDAARERRVTAASANFFDFFDAPPALGRYYTSHEDSVSVESPVVVLGWPLWQTEFGGQPDVLGKTLRVGRTLCTIIGVTPAGFTGIDERDRAALYVPITTFAKDLRGAGYATDYRSSWLELVVRRRAGVSAVAANADLTAAFRRSWVAQAASSAAAMEIGDYRPSASVGPVQLERGPQAGNEAKVLAWVTGIAVVVLLIACANVANLLLGRALARRREIALRLALGVSRGRLTRQLLTETLLLASLGGAIGMAIAQGGGATLRRTFFPGESALTLVTDARTLLVAVLSVLLAALLTGITPIAFAMRSEVSSALTGAARTTESGAAGPRAMLLVLQAAMSVVLLVGAGLFVRSLMHARSTRLGYDVTPLLIVSVHMRGVPLSGAERVALEQRLVGAARATAGVVGATRVASVPFWANEAQPLFVPGIDSVDARGHFYLQAGNPGYFTTVGTRLIRGRAFDAGDGARAPRVAVVSDGMAKALWPNVDPLGRCFRIGADTAPCTTVIGIAEDMRLRSLDEAREFTYYLPIDQYGSETGMLLVRVAGDAAASSEAVRHQLQRVMPGNAYVSAEPFSAVVDPTMDSWRLGATMFVAFGGLALILAGVGLYGLMAYAVTQRRRELGIRLALGATPRNVVRLVVGGGVRLVVAGTSIGVVLAVLSSRWIAPLLFQESPMDPFVYVIVTSVLIGVALLATAIPATAATRVDPNTVLRAE